MAWPVGARAITLAMTDSRLEQLFRGGWRAPLFAALVALAAALPGAIMLPATDRDEARFAQATAQMLETKDLVSINFQDQPRFKKPVGIHWLQALSVSALSSVEKREIWAYRIPSLLGAMAAAAACAWGAAAFWGARGGAIAGAILGASLILSTEGMIATTDAALCGAVTAAMAALARTYAASREETVARVGTRVVFWSGLALSMLLKGPIGPMVVLLAGAALWIWDRRAPWLPKLGWTWGIALILLIVGPWALAITVATDGAFWSGAVMGDMASKLVSGQESHWAPPGLHTLLSPLLLFPATALLPAALIGAWKGRASTGVRFALCWLVPAWIVFELAPTKLPHYPLPLYGALAWLCVAALDQPMGRLTRAAGAALAVLAGAALAAAGVYLSTAYRGPGSLPSAAAGAALMLASAVTGAVLIWLRQRPVAALAAAGGLAMLGHGVLTAAVAPSLKPLWIARRTATALHHMNLDPRNGVIRGPVAVAGYPEPSMVFLLGTRTELGDGEVAAAAIADGRPAVVDVAQTSQFFEALKAQEARAAPVAEVKGLNYSKGKPVDLILYRSLETGDQSGGQQ